MASTCSTYTFPNTNPAAPSGHLGHLNPEQQHKLQQLRKQLLSEGYTERLDDLTLLRFLRARKFDVAKAHFMFTETEKWRKEFGVDDIVKNFKFDEKPLVSAYYPQYYHKIDKDGRPVYIEQLGKVDLTAMYKITTQERLLQNLVNEYEKFGDPRLPACSRKAGKLIETSCTIMDLGGVGLLSAKQVYGYVQEASKISQNNYPERMGKFYLINAPWGFASVWSIIKRWLDPVTVDKISILGGSYQSTLLQQIPAENLPSNFGGTCRCPGGCELSDEGPWQDPKWLAPQTDALAPQTKEESAPAPIAVETSGGLTEGDTMRAM